MFVYKINLYFYKNYEKKSDKNGCDYIAFGIDIYFCENNLAVEFDEKRYVDRDRISEQKRQEALEKRVDCKFITTNPNKENYDVDYEIGKMQTFMSEFKNKRLKELEE